jgi:zinc/manganese transport system ATP-binding protein
MGAGMTPSKAPLALHDLTISHRGHPAVHHLSGHFVPGALTAVVGPNGAGKSTLLAALAGSRPDHQGRIDRDPAQRLAWLPQAAAIDRGFPMQVRELVSLGLWHRTGPWRRLRDDDHARIEQALAAVGLVGCGSRWIGELSAGQLQRVLFARVLLQDAGVILLDEPFNAIDARTTAELLALLPRWRSEGRTVIAVLHDLEQVRTHFDEVLLLARECIAWGPTGQVLRAEHLLRARRMAEAWDEQAPWCQAA